MPVIKISLTEEEFRQLEELAAQQGMSIQDLFRFKLLNKKNPSIFTPEEAMRRALEKFSSKGPGYRFTLPDIYGSDWSKLPSRMTGTFGKQVRNSDVFQFEGKTAGDRQAIYSLKG